MTSLNEWIDMKIKDGNIDYVEYGEFSNVEKVGEGAFGIINSAYWGSCGIKIAIKALINNSSVDKNIMDEFVKELKNLKKVSFHPNINGFFGISKEPLSNKYAMVLEYADQGNLREYLKIHINNLQWSDKIRMALDIVCGLKCLHFKHIIHRDLHAKNILVNNHKLMIADFGSSKQLSEATSVSANSKNDIIGMIEYMEPQCFKNIEYKKTKKSDIYSLGVLLWEISSGRPPFLGYHRNILAFHIGFNNLRENPIDGTPQDYQKLYQKCWDDEPNSRPDVERVYEILSQLKTEYSSCLQSSQPSIIEIKNSNIDSNGDLSISGCLNSGESSPRHKPNGFAEEALKNVDVDVLTLKDCVENATFDNLRINDTIVKNYEGKVETTRNINTTDGNNKTEEIYVVLLNGQKYAFQYNQVKNISELRKEIKKKLSVDEESKQKLIYKGVELQDQVITPCTLQYYEIEPGSHIQLIIVLYTESIKSLIFDSFWGYPANGTQDYLEGSCLLYIGDVLFRKYDYISAFYPSFPHIKHSGALMDNTNKRGHQRITAKLDKLPPEITQLYFVLSSFKSPTIGHFKAPSFKLIDETQPEPLCSYQLEQAAESQAIIICCISRVGQGMWEVIQIGKLSKGNVENYDPIEKSITECALFV
ncbi:kinase-like protein [Rhizophagus irregularis]|uniref:Kinase-like protein n=1 Tax=Rhizophagus irregularis TaxID=588596 RepID=A0A2N0P5X7_9GLOM|nr:kinase-like protein [Rhizophagus irregularis]